MKGNYMKRSISIILLYNFIVWTTVSLCSCSVTDPVETVVTPTETSSAVVTDETVQSSAAASTARPESQPSETAVNWDASYAPILDRYREFALLYAKWVSDCLLYTSPSPRD